MARIYIVRHGEAAASYTDDPNPGLSERGHEQAQAACDRLTGHLPLALVSSPLARARQTAAPLAKTTGNELIIDNRVSEVPSPGLALSERGPWLQQVMQGVWPEQSEVLRDWQQDMVNYLIGLKEDTAIFSHFVAINAVVSSALGVDRVLVCRPDNGSTTLLSNEGGKLTLIEKSEEANTHIN